MTPLTVAQINIMGITYQLNFYSEACFCLLPAEHLDGQENKSVFLSVLWTLGFCEHSRVQNQEEYSTWEGLQLFPSTF